VEELAVLDQPSRKLINKTSAFYSFQKAFCVYVKPKLAFLNYFGSVLQFSILSVI